MEPKSAGRSSAQLSNADHLDGGNRPVWSVCDQPILEHCRFWALTPDVRHRRNGFKSVVHDGYRDVRVQVPPRAHTFPPCIKNAPEALGSAAQGHFFVDRLAHQELDPDSAKPKRDIPSPIVPTTGRSNKINDLHSGRHSQSDPVDASWDGDPV